LIKQKSISQYSLLPGIWPCYQTIILVLNSKLNRQY